MWHQAYPRPSNQTTWDSAADETNWVAVGAGGGFGVFGPSGVSLTHLLVTTRPSPAVLKMKTLRLGVQSGLLLCSVIALTGTLGVRAQTLTLDEALDTTNLAWTTGGDAAWFGEVTNSYDDNGAACSVLTGPGQTSWLETTVVGPGTLSFWSVVADGIGFPHLPSAFLSFGVNPGQAPGGPGGWSSNWAQTLYDLPEGTNVLRWSFQTYSFATNGVIAAFLDQVVIGPARPLQITDGPSDVTVYARQAASLYVIAIGTPPITYQWVINGTDIPGATNATWFIQSVSTNDAGVYSARLTNPQGFLPSTNATLTVLPPSLPIIAYPPADMTVYSGQTAQWWVWADGSPPFAYQWFKNGTNLPGATSATLTITNVQMNDAGSYSLQVTNTEGSVLTSNALLTVLPSTAPIITRQPCSLNVAAGAAPVLSIQANGEPTLQYQWLRNGTNLPGATHSSLSFSNITAADAGVYSVRVANFLGATQSQGALVRVLAPLSALGSWFQGVNGLTVTNGLAYLAQGNDGLGVLDVTDPANPVMIGGYHTAGQALTVRLAGDLAYVAEGFSGLEILSVTNPAHPVRVGAYTTNSAQDLCVVGTLAYIAAADGGLRVVDVSNPAQPLPLGGLVTNMSATGVCVAGNLACVACPTVISQLGHPMVAGLQIIDVSNPLQPALLSTTSSDANAVALLGNVALTAGLNSNLQLFDVSNPAAPDWLGSFAPPPPPPPIFRLGPGASDVQAAGNLAYVPFGSNGLWVVDVSNPSAPVNVGRFTTIAAAQRVALSGNRAYVALGEAGLQIVALPANLGVEPFPALKLSHQNGFTLRLTGPAGAQAAIEYVDSLSGAPWQPLQTVSFTNGPVVLDVSSPAVTKRFFRARLLWQ